MRDIDSLLSSLSCQHPFIGVSHSVKQCYSTLIDHVGIALIAAEQGAGCCNQNLGLNRFCNSLGNTTGISQRVIHLEIQLAYGFGQYLYDVRDGLMYGLATDQPFMRSSSA